MSKPIVALVGRPNVGKSTLFNALIGERRAIVDDTPGVTRDRLYAESEWRGRVFSLVDTGGIEPGSDDPIFRSMRAQAEIAIETADVIVFLVDLKSDLTPDDRDIADLLRRSGKPVVLAINKVDHVGTIPAEAYAFYNLGLGELFPISATHRLGLGELLDEIFQYFPGQDTDEPGGHRIRVAVIGKPNVGKSSLVNTILGEERLIVSDMPGTTRDAVDSDVNHEAGPFTFIDTAGLRKKSRIDNRIERFSVIRALAAVDRSDLCLVMIDATEGATEQDTKVAGYAHNKGKASILVLNKWDVIKKETGYFEQQEKRLRSTFSFMPYAPVLAISAKTGQRVPDLLRCMKEVYEKAGLRLTTGLVNDLLAESVARVPTPQDKGRHLKIYYGTQIGVYPPRFALFINDRELMHFSYLRYLENQFRRSFDFTGTPIWFSLRTKEPNQT
jgi:GTPase